MMRKDVKTAFLLLAFIAVSWWKSGAMGAAVVILFFMFIEVVSLYELLDERLPKNK